MRIWIDCEFNSYKGALISMALVAEDGQELYGSLGCDDPHPWVAENVMPIIGTEPVSLEVFQALLEGWLAQFDSVHIIADWPEDLQHFCETLITGPGERIDTPPLTMEVVRIDAPSAQPHNALADARGIRDMHAALSQPVAEAHALRPVREIVGEPHRSGGCGGCHRWDRERDTGTGAGQRERLPGSSREALRHRVTATGGDGRGV